jgi:hypothetical protein
VLSSHPSSHYRLEVKGGATLEGETIGHAQMPFGVFLFPAQPGSTGVRRLFVPQEAIVASQIGARLGDLLVESEAATPAQVSEAAQLQGFPIETDGLRQVQVNPKIDWTFAKALRDMGMDPFNLADSPLLILAQRLVRRLRSQCRQSRPIADAHFTAAAPPDPDRRPCRGASARGARRRHAHLATGRHREGAARLHHHRRGARDQQRLSRSLILSVSPKRSLPQ